MKTDNDKIIKLNFSNTNLAKDLFGEYNKNLITISNSLKIEIETRGTDVIIKGDPITASLVKNILNQLYILLKNKYPVYSTDIGYAIKILSKDSKADLKSIFLDTVYITSKKKAITPKSKSQKQYIDAIRNYDIVFGIGPAGTGKTYLAMAMAVSALKKESASKIILARPAVEAGESLGFLPGDLADKIDPYLRPLYDALYDMIGFEKASNLIQQGVIEVAPLAFMRGRTLSNAFIILDEAQNTTSEQMKMFLTRIGMNSQAIITGDITQTDLPSIKDSGLIEAKNILTGINGIKMVFFSKNDVIRHKLVKQIIEAYETKQHHV